MPACHYGASVPAAAIPVLAARGLFFPVWRAKAFDLLVVASILLYSGPTSILRSERQDGAGVPGSRRRWSGEGGGIKGA